MAESRPGRVWRAVRGRRAFLATALAGSGALVVRFALLPRPLSDEQIAALAAASTAAAPAVAVGPGGEELDFDLRRSLPNPLAVNFELGPIQVRWQRVFRINTVERTPRRDVDRWSLRVDGLVAEPGTYDANGLHRLGRVPVVASFQCVEGWGVQDVRWEGVPLARAIERARPLPEARFATFHTLGGVYTESLTLAQALRADVLLADARDGAPLPEDQGLPLRLVVPFMFGYKSAKWVNRVELTRVRHVGYWERRGWLLDPYL